MKNALYHINADLILPMKLSFNKLETNQKKLNVHVSHKKNKVINNNGDKIIH